MLRQRTEAKPPLLAVVTLPAKTPAGPPFSPAPAHETEAAGRWESNADMQVGMAGGR